MKSAIQLFRLSNGVIDVVLSNYGCTIVSVHAPDRNGMFRNIVAGFSNPENYLSDHPYFGSTVGRFANRIANGKFAIDEIEYQLPLNDNENHLHGGWKGFDRQFWRARQSSEGISFSYLSRDGEEGYPGNMDIVVNFSLTRLNELVISYHATTDKNTIINLTNHSYFNLSGFEIPTVYDHALRVHASHYTVKNQNNIPTEEIASVVNTPYDFMTSKLIGKDIHLLSHDRGYDINYVLERDKAKPTLAAELFHERSGRLLKVYTDQPGMQLYTANEWDGRLNDNGNGTFCQHGAVALETQAFPDSPNHKHFTNTILRPGEKYHTETVYQFLVV